MSKPLAEEYYVMRSTTLWETDGSGRGFEQLFRSDSKDECVAFARTLKDSEQVTYIMETQALLFSGGLYVYKEETQ